MISQILNAVLVLALLTACNNPFSPKEERPYKVHLLLPDAQGKYTFQVRTLETLEDPVTVESSEIKIRINSKFYADKIEDQVPQANYGVNSDGVLLPKDAKTFLYYGLYYNLEQLLKFDKKAGIENLLPRPRIAGIQTEVVKSFMGNMRAWKNNLAYLTGADRIVVYKFDDSKLPAALNLGMMGHEHAHAIFDFLVKPQRFETILKQLNEEITIRYKSIVAKKMSAQNLTEEEASKMDQQILFEKTQLNKEERKLFTEEIKKIHQGPSGFNFLMLNALTEGFADFWGWLVTGEEIPADATFKDVPALKDFDFKNRAVVGSAVNVMLNEYKLKSDFNFYNYIREEQGELPQGAISVRAWFYFYGTMYSNVMRALSEQIFKNETQEKRKIKTAQWIVRSLKEFKIRMEVFYENQTASEYLSQDMILSSFIPNKMKAETAKDVCTTLKGFLTVQPDAYSKIKKCENVL